MANQDDFIRITLRIPGELHARLALEAIRTSKSMNAEIVARLEASFEEHESIDPDQREELELLAEQLKKGLEELKQATRDRQKEVETMQEIATRLTLIEQQKNSATSGDE